MRRLPRPRRHPRLCALLLALAAASPAAADLSFEEGLAQRRNGPGLLYREQHWIRRDGPEIAERLVLYQCPDGTAFARKHVDYRPSALAPAFHFEDRRSGYREGLRWAGAPQVFVRAPPGLAEKAARLSPEQLVADAGFDEFIRRHWSDLLAGREVPLAFAIPARLQSFGFRLRRSGVAQAHGEPAWVFRLALGGWLRWLAPRVDVHYGQHSRRLLRFEGPSNLLDDAGRAPLDTRIDFPQPPRAADEAQWQAAARRPLGRCQTNPAADVRTPAGKNKLLK